MKLILFRHGETKEGKKNIILGKLPGNLSTKGIRESKKIATAIKKMNINPSLIISSDLKRAKDTAKIISKIIKLPIRYEKLLRERSASVVEGKNEKNIDWDTYEKKPLEIRKHKGGESFSDVKKRAKKFIKKVKLKNLKIKQLYLYPIMFFY